MTTTSVFINCARPTTLTIRTSSEIFTNLMKDINLYCSKKRHDGFEEYIFVGSSKTNLRRGTTLHLFVRDDGLIELATARNFKVTQSIIAEPKNLKAFEKLERALRRKLSAMHAMKRGTLRDYFQQHAVVKTFELIKTDPIEAAILPTVASKRLQVI